MRVLAHPAVAWTTLAVAAILQISFIADVIPRLEVTSQAIFWPGILLGYAFFTYVAIGALIASRRPRNPVGWIFIGIGLGWDLQTQAHDALARTLRDPGVAALDPHTWPAVAWPLSLFANAWSMSLLLLPILFLVFPTGRPLSARWTPVMWLAAADAGFGMLTGSTRIGGNSITFPLLIAVLGDLGQILRSIGEGITALGMLVLYPVSVAALVIRLRRSRGVEREQLLWFSYACVLLVLITLLISVLWLVPTTRELDPSAPFPGAMFRGIPFALALVALPVASAIAILRHRLLDIDRLIGRTLVYGALSTTLLMTYAVAVVILQTVVQPITSGSEFAVAASTLVVVALFQPLRRRIQDAVDRRFYRSRYDAARTIDAFTTRMRDQVDLDAVRSEVLGVVGATLSPAHASVWFRNVPS